MDIVAVYKELFKEKDTHRLSGLSVVGVQRGEAFIITSRAASQRR